MNKFMKYLGNYKKNETVEHKNCKIIEKKLLEHGIPVKYVGRHHLFGIDYFKLVIDASYNDYIFEENICEVFDIPKEWVGFTSVNPKVLCIKENEMIDRFGNCKGILELGGWDIKGKSWKDVEVRLFEEGIDAKVDTDTCGEFKFYSIRLTKNFDCVDYTCIKRALNVDDVGIVNCDNIYIVERTD